MDVSGDSALQRILRSGWATASANELLALAISESEADLAQAEVRAQRLLREVGGMSGLGEISRTQLQEFAGCDDYAAYRNLAWLELGRRAAEAGKGPRESILDPATVAHMLRHLQREKQEHFVVLLLDAKNGLMKIHDVHKGTLSMSVVGPREVFREAIREGASAMIVAHNHPSGDPEPSPEDIEVTRRLDEIGNLLDIKVWDHIILGLREWVSLRQRGLFDSGPNRVQLAAATRREGDPQ